MEIMAIGYGIVEMIQPNGEIGCVRTKCADHGLGNTVIIKHVLVDIDQPVYSMYSHLDSFADGLKKGCIKIGDRVGTMGSTGYGEAKYWGNTPHLHLEIKTKPVLNGPKFGGATYGYISPKNSSNDPAKHKAELEEHGFYDPKDFINEKSFDIPIECPRS
jgi:murein DD-endopeptidase MepM/ murein hydrolase activator NlpD